MTTLFLVRHATHALVGRILAGRMCGLSLSEEGRRQSHRLAARLAAESLTLVQSSPRERAMQTAEPIAAAAQAPLATEPAIDEIEYGEWTGRPFAELKNDMRWREWNTHRDRVCPPRGEFMADAQQRLIAHLEATHRAHPDGRIVMVTHAEMIRAAVLHHLGLPLEAYDRIEISPASVTVLRIGKTNAEISTLNEAVAA